MTKNLVTGAKFPSFLLSMLFTYNTKQRFLKP
jgi:hypothetical protein